MMLPDDEEDDDSENTEKDEGSDGSDDQHQVYKLRMKLRIKFLLVEPQLILSDVRRNGDVRKRDMI